MHIGHFLINGTVMGRSPTMDSLHLSQAEAGLSQALATLRDCRWVNPPFIFETHSSNRCNMCTTQVKNFVKAEISQVPSRPSGSGTQCKSQNQNCVSLSKINSLQEKHTG